MLSVVNRLLRKSSLPNRKGMLDIILRRRTLRQAFAA